MNLNVYTYRIQSLLQEAKNVLILLKKQPDLDLTAASLSLYLSLIQKGKQVTIVCPDRMLVSHSNLFAIDKITDELGKKGKNLVISFPYVEGSIEKVSYNIENNRFNLVIEPRGEGINTISRDIIEFSRSGEGADSYDIIFAIGISELDDLAKLQTSVQKLINDKPVVSVNNNSAVSQFGTINVNSPSNSSISEILTLLLYKLNLPIDRDIAGNLLTGIKEKTNNFSKDSSADAFEAAAICMRKMSDSVSENTNQWVSRQPQGLSKQPVQGQTSAMPRMGIDSKKTPPDWLKPKIYRSSEVHQDKSDSDNGSIL